MKNQYKNVKAIVFDFGDVLGFMKQPVDAPLRKAGINLDKFIPAYSDVINSFNLGQINERQFFLAVEKIFSVKISYHKFHQLFDEKYLNYSLIDLIKKLKEKYKIGLLSNISETTSREYIFKPKLDQLFDAQVLSHQVGKRKPNPEVYLMITKKLELEPEEILFIDDKENRTEPAAALGMKTLIYKGKETDQLLESLL